MEEEEQILIAKQKDDMGNKAPTPKWQGEGKNISRERESLEEHRRLKREIGRRGRRAGRNKEQLGVREKQWRGRRGRNRV